MIIPFMYIENTRKKIKKLRKKDQRLHFGWIDIETACKQPNTRGHLTENAELLRWISNLEAEVRSSFEI